MSGEKKIHLTSLAMYTDTVASAAEGLMKTEEMGRLGQAHIQTVAQMLRSCAQSLRAFAASEPMTGHTSPPPGQEKEQEADPSKPDEGMSGGQFLSDEEENFLAEFMDIGDDTHG